MYITDSSKSTKYNITKIIKFIKNSVVIEDKINKVYSFLTKQDDVLLQYLANLMNCDTTINKVIEFCTNYSNSDSKLLSFLIRTARTDKDNYNKLITNISWAFCFITQIYGIKNYIKIRSLFKHVPIYYYELLIILVNSDTKHMIWTELLEKTPGMCKNSTLTIFKELCKYDNNDSIKDLKKVLRFG